jgi:hypothetical protein
MSGAPPSWQTARPVSFGGHEYSYEYSHSAPAFRQLQPLVAPQVLHFMQVPFRTSV